jgi:CheY-like chemotaxis protein
MALRPLVLIVDDDADIREGLSELLSDEGFAVATASNGLQAIEWLRERRPGACIIILDLMMPIMDGRAFLHAKQCEPGLAALPVVVITAGRPDFDHTSDVQECIPKPLHLPRLFAALAACR